MSGHVHTDAPWCGTCGKVVTEVTCQQCSKWWADHDLEKRDMQATIDAHAKVIAEFDAKLAELLQTDVQKLRILVEEAYREGFDDAQYHFEHHRLTTIDESYADSKTRTELRKIEE